MITAFSNVETCCVKWLYMTRTSSGHVLYVDTFRRPRYSHFLKSVAKNLQKVSPCINGDLWSKCTFEAIEVYSRLFWVATLQNKTVNLRSSSLYFIGKIKTIQQTTMISWHRAVLKWMSKRNWVYISTLQDYLRACLQAERVTLAFTHFLFFFFVVTR